MLRRTGNTSGGLRGAVFGNLGAPIKWLGVATYRCRTLPILFLSLHASNGLGAVGALSASRAVRMKAGSSTEIAPVMAKAWHQICGGTDGRVGGVSNDN
jgi:hypothetical protein